MKWTPHELKQINYIIMVIHGKSSSIYDAVTRLNYKMPYRTRESIRSKLYREREKHLAEFMKTAPEEYR